MTTLQTIGAVTFFFVFIPLIIWDFLPSKEERLWRRKEKKEKQARMEHELKQKQENLRLKKEQWERQLVLEKEARLARYNELRQEIEKMPISQRWKQDVRKKCENKCQMCGLSNNTQVHHLDSFYLILRQNNINSVEKAFECKQLWDIDNGEVLCKDCHDKMESSKNRQAFVLKNNQN